MKKILIALVFATSANAAHAEYLGRLGGNPFYGDSCQNPFSRCGNPFNAKSPRNEFGPYGNPYSPYSVNNPFGGGVRVYGDAAPDDE
jgi:hypothetical protein